MSLDQIQTKYTDVLVGASDPSANPVDAAVGLAGSVARSKARTEALRLNQTAAAANAAGDAAARAARDSMTTDLQDWYDTNYEAADGDGAAKTDAAERARDARARAFVKSNDLGARMGQAVNVAGAAVKSVGSFVATFKDNPGKTLLSLEVGVLIGIGVAAALQLDVFQAVLQPDAKTDEVFAWANGLTFEAIAASILGAKFFGVVATGILIGLGSNPTHEAIQSLKQYKVDKKLAGAPFGGATSDTTGDSDQLGIDFAENFVAGGGGRVRRRIVEPARSARIYFR